MRAIEIREIATRLGRGRVAAALAKETVVVAVKPARTGLKRTLEQVPNGFHFRLSNSSPNHNINMTI